MDHMPAGTQLMYQMGAYSHTRCIRDEDDNGLLVAQGSRTASAGGDSGGPFFEEDDGKVQAKRVVGLVAAGVGIAASSANYSGLAVDPTSGLRPPVDPTKHQFFTCMEFFSEWVQGKVDTWDEVHGWAIDGEDGVALQQFALEDKELKQEEERRKAEALKQAAEDGSGHGTDRSVEEKGGVDGDRDAHFDSD